MPDAEPSLVRFGPYEADLRSGRLRRRGVTVSVPDKSFQVLAVLLQRPGEVVSRDELRRCLWPANVFVDFENNLNAAVARLREALRDAAARPRFIETLPRRGYRFIGKLGEPQRVPESAPVKQLRLVVLPFTNMSSDPEQEYFADGVTEGTIAELASAAPSNLAVIARTSAMHYKGSRKDIARIGRELNVDFAIEGSVRRAGGRVRITAQLIRVADQTHVWAREFDSEFRDVLQLERAIAHSIAQQTDIVLSAAGRRCPPLDPEALDAYLRGLHHYSRLTPATCEKAVACFGEALVREPSFAAAHARLALTHSTAGYFGFAPRATAFPKAEVTAQRALELDGTMVDAHIALGTVCWFHYWDLTAARRELEQAVRLGPSDPTAHWLLSTLLGSMWQDFQSATREANLALRLDPASIAVRSTVAFVFQWSRQYRRAALEARRTLELDENAPPAYWPLIMAEMAMGNFEDAIQDAEKAAAKFADPISLAYLGMALGLGGRGEYALGVLHQLQEAAASGCVSAVCPAWVCIGLGHHELALDYLEKAFQEHDPMVLWIRAASSYDPLRGDPRFERLLRRLGLPDLQAS